jgi:hypothetical protein
MSPAGLGPENNCAGENKQQLQMSDPSSRQRGCYVRTITASVRLKNKNSGRESQGVCRKDALIRSKQPVVI